jgi:hypothetical protein
MPMNDPMNEGRVPLKELVSIPKYDRVDRPAKELGSAPEKEFCDKRKNFKPVSAPREEGREPMKELPQRSRYVSAPMFPIDEGK